MIRIWSTQTGEELSFEGMLRRLRGVDAVFLGETHLDDTTHRFELAVYEGLIRQTEGKVVLAMEMFSRDVQPTLDRYVTGEIDESEFRKSARPWGNYGTGYRALVERARRDRLPVVGSNVPLSVRRKVAMGGREAFEGLTEEERSWISPDLRPNSPEYWERFARVVRGHAGMMIGSEENRLYSTQSLWDNTMGFSCADALERHPGFVVLHVNGGFHTAYHQGTVEQFASRRPQAKLATITVRPTSDLPHGTWSADDEDEQADYVVFAEARARGTRDATHGVSVSRELSYRVHVPGSASEASPAPLFIWLSEEGVRPDDELRYWRLVLGDDAAVVVVEPPYPQLEETLFTGGRWYWSRTFSEDLGAIQGGLDRICGYLVRYFPVDLERTVLAGRGAGATAVVATALYTDRLPVKALAFDPGRYTKLRENALPAEAPVTRSLRVFPTESSATWWKQECDEYRGVGLSVTLEDPTGGDPPVETLLRESLELEGSPGPSGASTLLVLRVDSPLARQWARLLGAALRKHQGARVEITSLSELPRRMVEGGVDEIRLLALPGELPVDPAGAALSPGVSVTAFASGLSLPTAPGAFGGTTVVVLPESVPDEAREAWAQIESTDAIKKRSRFARLVVAHSDREPGLAAVLEGIRSSGRSNVLVVPATFAATGDEMRELRRRAGSLDRLDIAWLPGLGARIYLQEVKLDEVPGH